ncbi:MAG: PKD domain-containing protein, partial [Gemmatimonadetes bacterium]|nr:PKD domain-containing protein [Gemmatimonadota bacterium]
MATAVLPAAGSSSAPRALLRDLPTGRELPGGAGGRSRVLASLPEGEPDANDDTGLTRENEPVTIDVLANDTDPEGDFLTVSITSTPDDGSVTLNGDQTITYTPDAGFDGRDDFKYQVDDGQGHTDEAKVEITVTRNAEPEATIDQPSGNVSIDQDGAVDFAGTGSDSDGSVVSYLWDFDNTPGAPADQFVEDPGSLTFSTPGTFRVAFTVFDNDGAQDTSPSRRTITVIQTAPGNDPPVAEILTPTGFTRINVGEFVNFTGRATDNDGTITDYLWDFSGSGAPADRTVEDPGNVQFNTAGTFSVTFNVTDDDQLQDPTPETRQIQVVAPPPPGNALPTARIDTPAAPLTTILVGQSVTFTGSASDTDGSITGYRWDFNGSGAPADRTMEDPGPVQFSSIGLFSVTFNVTDNEGGQDSSPETVQVQVVSQPPPTNAAPSVTIDQPAGSVTISAGQ